MENKRHCIICDKLKAESEFDNVGEHIIPESLGNRSLVTHRVCSKCNGGLGCTVDFALRRFFSVSQACSDRNVVGATGSVFESRRVPDSIVDDDDTEFGGYLHGRPVFVIKDNTKTAKRLKSNLILSAGANNSFITKEKDNAITHEIIAAWIKIAYEVTHLKVGDEWLADDVANKMREILHHYAEGKISEAQALIDKNEIQIIDASKEMKTHKDYFAWIAEARRTCVNSLWLITIANGKADGIKVVIDIEGLPAVCVSVSHTMRYEDDIVLILPK